MKKIVTYISALFLLLILVYSSAYAAESKTNSAIEEVIKAAEAKKNTFLAHDMYLKIYVETNVEPEKKALKNTGKKFGMTDSQIQSIVRDGDLSALGNNKQNTLEKAHLQYAKIMNDYNSEIETENLRSELESAVKPSEIFADGDTSNSDFDLIYDLSVIEIILFNEASTNKFGGSFDSPNVDVNDPAELAGIADLFEDPDLNLRGDDDDDATEDANTDKDESGIDALECLEGDSDLENSLNEFEEEQDRQANEDGQGGSGGNEDDGWQNGDNTEDFPSAPTDDWSLEDLCPDGAFFCIDIEFIKKQAKIGGASSTSKSDCILCTVEKINTAFDGVLEKPTSSNKMTGNILEIPKCKSSQTSLPANINIVTIAVAVPHTENLFAPTNVAKEWQKMMERANPLYFKKTAEAEKEAESKPDENLNDRAAQKALVDSSPSATLEEVSNRASDTTETENANTVKQEGTAKQAETAEKQNRHYKNISRELSTMNIHFENMKKLFEQMKTPCNALANKSNCQ